MSAFIVSHAHIDQVVTSYEKYVATVVDRTHFGRVLLRENYKSVNHLYEEVPDADADILDYTYTKPHRQLMALEALKVVECYEYQACEYPAYATGEVALCIKTLQTALVRSLHVATVEVAKKLPGYPAAAWEICEDTPSEPEPVAPQREVRQISLKETAVMVRAALKAQFPTVKFSVRCDTYSMGCSIDVTWIDGPTEKEVEPICKHFSGKHFDGMDDSTHYLRVEHEGALVHFQADYVTPRREYSPEFLGKINTKVATQYGVEPLPLTTYTDKKSQRTHAYCASSGPMVDSYETGMEHLSTMIHRVCARTSALPKPRITVYPDVVEVAL